MFKFGQSVLVRSQTAADVVDRDHHVDGHVQEARPGDLTQEREVGGAVQDGGGVERRAAQAGTVGVHSACRASQRALPPQITTLPHRTWKAMTTMLVESTWWRVAG
ncbi:hypothetical protein M758_UG139300 [Ceratodon purpureus]|nr:hypothetical protein M758_UG139300 [Ceratodon purpureus]